MNENKEVIIVGGGSLPYKLTDMHVAGGVVCETRKVPTHMGRSNHFHQISSGSKREVKPSKPITLRNLFDVPR